jgi:hypothetical protein
VCRTTVSFGSRAGKVPTWYLPNVCNMHSQIGLAWAYTVPRSPLHVLLLAVEGSTTTVPGRLPLVNTYMPLGSRFRRVLVELFSVLPLAVEPIWTGTWYVHLKRSTASSRTGTKCAGCRKG